VGVNAFEKNAKGCPGSVLLQHCTNGRIRRVGYDGNLGLRHGKTNRAALPNASLLETKAESAIGVDFSRLAVRATVEEGARTPG